MPFLSFPGAFDRQELKSTYTEFLTKMAREVVPEAAVPPQLLVEGDTTESLIEAAARTEASSSGSAPRPLAVRRAAAGID